MTAPEYDEDDVHRIVHDLIELHQHQQVVEAAATKAVTEVREHMVAIALARRLGIDEDRLIDTANTYSKSLTAEVLRRMVFLMAWDGGTPAEVEAKRRCVEVVALDADICPDEQEHRRLDRTAAQEHVLPVHVEPSCCRWCGKRLPSGGTS